MADDSDVMIAMQTHPVDGLPGCDSSDRLDGELRSSDHRATTVLPTSGLALFSRATTFTRYVESYGLLVHFCRFEPIDVYF
jgi:hypothetical protein